VGRVVNTLCFMHYQRQKRTGSFDLVPRVIVSVCTVPDCERPAYHRTWCGRHYSRWYVHGDLNYVRPTSEELFWAKVDKNGPIPDYAPHLGPCWIWTRGLSNGYGSWAYGPKADPIRGGAHRYSYEISVGPIPEGLDLDHLCRIPACVNPTHLEPVTSAENTRRGTRHNLHPYCRYGHPYDEANTYIVPSTGARQCRECNRTQVDRRSNSASGRT